MRESMRQHWIAAGFALGLLAAPAVARAQITVVTPATPSTLGAIGTPSSTCATRAVTFDVAGVDVVRAVRVSMTVRYTHTAGYLGVTLTDPGGRAFAVLPLGGALYSARSFLDGTYVLSDTAAGTWFDALTNAGTGTVPSGTYRTVEPSGAATTSLDAEFGGRLSTGTWTLTFRNCTSPATGAVSAAVLTIVGNAGVAQPATPATLGSIPDGTSPRRPGRPRDVTFVVPPGRGPVAAVRVSMTLTHSFAGDLTARLIAPTGQSHVVFGDTGVTASAPDGSPNDLAGTYSFSDAARGSRWWPSVVTGPSPVPGGAFRTSEPGGPGATGVDTLMDPVFAGVASQGVWTLRLVDSGPADVGTITAAHLSLETVATPTAISDGYTSVYPAPLTLAAPGVLSNDQSNFNVAMTAQLVSGPARGILALQASGAFTYTPAPGFIGTDSFVYRALNTQGPGTTATVSIAVTTPTTVQAPYGLTASLIQGNQVTLRWQAAPGPVPADYVMEGGIAPGQTLGAVAAGGPPPALTFLAPTGVFFVRVHAIANGQRSGPSNEIRIVVNVPEAPSTPVTLTGLANGSQLGLAWKNTFAGGAAQGLQLTVTGTANGVIPLPLSESMTFGGVPAGTYTFRMRALNAAGVSVESNPVTLTFPSGCSGPPQVPLNFLAYATGNVVHVLWDPPATGPSALTYVLQVSGSLSGALPMVTRGLRTSAPPGAYVLSVVAVNPCGMSAPTAAQTVFVP